MQKILFNDSLHDITQYLTDIVICFPKISLKDEIFIFWILPKDEYCLVNKTSIKEITLLLQFKWAFHQFSLFNKIINQPKTITCFISYYLIKIRYIRFKENYQISKINYSSWRRQQYYGRNTDFSELRINNHRQFMKSYNMALFFKLNNTGFPPWSYSTVRRPVTSVSISLPFTTAWICSWMFVHFPLILSSATNKPFLSATSFSCSSFAHKCISITILNRMCLILLVRH